jgi:hypothetical protein
VSFENGRPWFAAALTAIRLHAYVACMSIAACPAINLRPLAPAMVQERPLNVVFRGLRQGRQFPGQPAHLGDIDRLGSSASCSLASAIVASSPLRSKSATIWRCLFTHSLSEAKSALSNWRCRWRVRRGMGQQRAVG